MLNNTRIAELMDEVGEDDFAEVVELFCEEVEETLAELSTTPQSALAGKLHFLKGSALNIGMEAVGQLCLAEEARLKVTPDATPDIAAIETAYRTSKAELTG